MNKKQEETTLPIRDPKRHQTSSLFDYKLSSSQMCQQFKWLREHMEILNANKKYLKCLLENILFSQKETPANSVDAVSVNESCSNVRRSSGMTLKSMQRGRSHTGVSE